MRNIDTYKEEMKIYFPDFINAREEPNWEMIKQSCISAMKTSYSNYKKAEVELIKSTWINDSGHFCVLGNFNKLKETVENYMNEYIKMKERFDFCCKMIDREDK